jgi:hypothetical protein
LQDSRAALTCDGVIDVADAADVVPVQRAIPEHGCLSAPATDSYLAWTEGHGPLDEVGWQKDPVILDPGPGRGQDLAPFGLAQHDAGLAQDAQRGVVDLLQVLVSQENGRLPYSFKYSAG